MSEDDTRSAVLCRSGVTFVDKMDQFHYRGAQSVRASESLLDVILIMCDRMLI